MATIFDIQHEMRKLDGAFPRLYVPEHEVPLASFCFHMSDLKCCTSILQLTKLAFVAHHWICARQSSGHVTINHILYMKLINPIICGQ